MFQVPKVGGRFWTTVLEVEAEPHLEHLESIPEETVLGPEVLVGRDEQVDVVLDVFDDVDDSADDVQDPVEEAVPTVDFDLDPEAHQDDQHHDDR